jgi:hypothetical protein
MYRDISNRFDIAVRANHIRVPTVRHRPIEIVCHRTCVQVFTPSCRFHQPGNVSLMRWSTFRQIMSSPTAEVKDHGVVVLNVGAIFRSFALPHWTSPFSQYITADSDIVIFSSVSLKFKCYSRNSWFLDNLKEFSYVPRSRIEFVYILSHFRLYYPVRMSSSVRGSSCLAQVVGSTTLYDFLSKNV